MTIHKNSFVLTCNIWTVYDTILKTRQNKFHTFVVSGLMICFSQGSHFTTVHRICIPHTASFHLCVTGHVVEVLR